MNWKNVKIFMIALLVIADIFLAVTLILQKNDTLYNKESIEDIQALLAESGIEVDEKFLDLKTTSGEIYVADMSDYQSYISKKFMKNSISETFATPDGVKFFSEEGDGLEIKNVFEISFSRASFSLPESGGNKVESASELKKIRKQISELLFSESEREDYSVLLEEATKYGNVTVAKLKQTINGKNIENSSLICCTKDEKLMYLSGKWCFMPTDSKNSAHLLDSVNILFIEKSDIDENTAEGEAKKTRKIKNMELCSWAFVTKDNSGISFIPSWHIEWEDGESSFYNALDGKKHVIVN